MISFLENTLTANNFLSEILSTKNTYAKFPAPNFFTVLKYILNFVKIQQLFNASYQVCRMFSSLVYTSS